MRVSLAPHDRAAVAAKGGRIVETLIGMALAPAGSLPMVDRVALAVLALAVEAEVASCIGADPPPGRLPQLAEALARVEAKPG